MEQCIGRAFVPFATFTHLRRDDRNKLPNSGLKIDQPSRKCFCKEWDLYCVSTKIRRRPECKQLVRVKSIMRYLPPNGTAGFALSSVRGDKREPIPPAKTTVKVSCIFCLPIIVQSTIVYRIVQILGQNSETLVIFSWPLDVTAFLFTSSNVTMHSLSLALFRLGYSCATIMQMARRQKTVTNWLITVLVVWLSSRFTEQKTSLLTPQHDKKSVHAACFCTSIVHVH